MCKRMRGTWGLQDIDYLATVTLSGGKVFAMFIKSPAKVS
jgi:hypothetical protein